MVCERAQSQVASRPRFDWAALNPQVEWQERYGIKVGLTALLALWIAQVLRLEHPNWSVVGGRGFGAGKHALCRRHRHKGYHAFDWHDRWRADRHLGGRRLRQRA